MLSQRIPAADPSAPAGHLLACGFYSSSRLLTPLPLRGISPYRGDLYCALPASPVRGGGKISDFAGGVIPSSRRDTSIYYLIYSLFYGNTVQIGKRDWREIFRQKKV